MIDDDIKEHGNKILADCLWAVIYKYEDGYIWCPILSTDGKCEDCYEAFEKWQEKEERRNKDGD